MDLRKFTVHLETETAYQEVDILAEDVVPSEGCLIFFTEFEGTLPKAKAVFPMNRVLFVEEEETDD